MTAPPTPQTRRQELLLKTRLDAEIQEGMAAARDPDNADLPDLHARLTTMYSPWYTRTCPVCKHRFREGDRVQST